MFIKQNMDRESFALSYFEYAVSLEEWTKKQGQYTELREEVELTVCDMIEKGINVLKVPKSLNWLAVDRVIHELDAGRDGRALLNCLRDISSAHVYQEKNAI